MHITKTLSIALGALLCLLLAAAAAMGQSTQPAAATTATSGSTAPAASTQTGGSTTGQTGSTLADVATTDTGSASSAIFPPFNPQTAVEEDQIPVEGSLIGLPIMPSTEFQPPQLPPPTAQSTDNTVPPPSLLLPAITPPEGTPIPASGAALDTQGLIGGTQQAAIVGGINPGGSANAGEQPSFFLPIPAGYTITDLGVLRDLDFSSEGRAINTQGRILGLASDGVLTHSFLYDQAMTDLGTLGGDWSHSGRKEHLADSGAACGTTSDGRYRRAFLYTGGRMVDLGSLSGTSSVANGIGGNRVAGYSPSRQGQNHAFIQEGGFLRDLGTLSDQSAASFATSISRSGQWVTGASNSRFGSTHAFVWSAETGMLDLGSLAGRFSSSLGLYVNNRGEVAGVSPSINFENHAVLFTSGRAYDVGTLGGDSSWPTDLNNKGNMVGFAARFGSFVHAFIFSVNEGLVDLGTLGGYNSVAYDISDSGFIAGAADTIFGDRHACVWDKTFRNIIDLNSYVDEAGADFATLDEAYAVNENGWITGVGTTAAGDRHAFLAVPNAAPTAAATGTSAAGTTTAATGTTTATSTTQGGAQTP